MRFFKKKKLTLRQQLDEFFINNLEDGQYDFGLTMNNGKKYNFIININHKYYDKKYPKIVSIAYENFWKHEPHLPHRYHAIDYEWTRILFDMKEQLLKMLLAKEMNK